MVTVDAVSTQSLRGVVDRVNPAADVTQGVATYPAVIKVTGAPGEIRPGMSARVTIVVEQKQSVLLVPNRALRTRGRDRVVAIEKDGALEWVTVQVGSANDTQSEITSGLEEGQRVVTNPPTPPALAVSGTRTPGATNQQGGGQNGGFPAGGITGGGVPGGR